MTMHPSDSRPIQDSAPQPSVIALPPSSGAPGVRARLLRAALQAFHTQGFHRATVAHIRASAGVSNGSFFHCFASKEALAGQLYLHALGDYHAHMQAALIKPHSAAAGIAAFIHAHAEWVLAHREAARFLFEQAQADWLTEVRDQQQAGNAAFRAALEGWLQHHREAWVPLPLPLLLAQLIGPVQFMCRRWLTEAHLAQQPVVPEGGNPAGRAAHHAELAGLVASAQRALLHEA